MGDPLRKVKPGDPLVSRPALSASAEPSECRPSGRSAVTRPGDLKIEVGASRGRGQYDAC